MNESSLITAHEPNRRASWLDAHMPDGHPAQLQQQPRFLSLSTIRGMLHRQRWLVCAIILAAAIGGLAATLLAKPMYEASTTVRIEPYGSQIVEGQNIDMGISSNQVFNLMSTQIAIITSRSLAAAVAEDLNLGESDDFFGPDVDGQRPAAMSDEQWAATKQDMAAAILHGGVSAEIPDNNWIIKITYRSEDLAIAAQVANAYSAAFVATESETTVATNEYAQTYLTEQIELTRGRLQEAEVAANSYARNNGIIIQSSTSDGGDAGPTLTAANLGSINARVAAARAERIEAEQRWRSVQNMPASQLPEVQTNPVLQSLIVNLATKRTELSDLQQRYNEDFPQITNLRAQIATIEQQISRSSANIKAAVRNEFVVARNQEQALRAELSALTSDTLAEQDRQVDYSVLEREAQALRDQLQVLLNRFNEISTAADVRSGMINPLDAAQVPRAPYSPSLFRNLSLALLLGGAFAAGLAVLRESFDDKIRSLEEVEEKLGLPLFGHTPHVKESEVEIEGDNFGHLMEAYASIRLTIDFAMPGERNVIQFTSCEAAEGKTTTATILAELFAGIGRKVLLVDGDLRRPSIGKLFSGTRSKVGLVEVLLGQADLESTIIKGREDNLDILPVGEVPTNPSEIFASSQMRKFIEKYRSEYSLIIFDSSPILGLADAPMLSGLVDGTIFVMEANRVQFSQARAAIQRLRSSGGNPFGTVLTKYRALEAGELYNYQYGYYEYNSST